MVVEQAHGCASKKLLPNNEFRRFSKHQVKGRGGGPEGGGDKWQGFWGVAQRGQFRAPALFFGLVYAMLRGIREDTLLAG